MKKRFILIFLILLTASICQAQETANEGFITTKDGVKLFYKIVGSGKETLVAVHGGPGNSLESIRTDLEPLAKNRRVIYYDQRGNGRSDLIKDGDKLAVGKHVEDLETVRKHFKLDKMTLLGNSWGGMLILYYAIAHPDKIERMILHNPGPPSREFWYQMSDEIDRRVKKRYDGDQLKEFIEVANPETWIKAADPRAVCRKFYQMILSVYGAKPDAVDKLKGDLCTGSEETIRYQQFVNKKIWNSQGEWDLPPLLGVVKFPVLVIHGEADVIPVKASEASTAAMPNARLLVIKDSGHMPQVEQPKIFFDAVETFLKGEFPKDAKKIELSQK